MSCVQSNCQWWSPSPQTWVRFCNAVGWGRGWVKSQSRERVLHGRHPIAMPVAVYLSSPMQGSSCSRACVIIGACWPADRFSGHSGVRFVLRLLCFHTRSRDLAGVFPWPTILHTTIQRCCYGGHSGTLQPLAAEDCLQDWSGVPAFF